MAATKVLVAPLDWGLGHATRCIPLVRELQKQGAEVYLASNGRAACLLQREFPNLQHLYLPGYDIQYSSNERFFSAYMAVQIPRILKSIAQENAILQKWIAKMEFRAVISDNRYGCYSPNAHCVLLTHQIFIDLPPKITFLSPILTRLNQYFIGKFNECWIPDFANPKQCLSGNLSHLKTLPNKQFRFIGALSRMAPLDPQAAFCADILAIVSGPEPQRSLFEKILLEQAKNLPTDQQIVIVGGRTESKNRRQIAHNLLLIDSLESHELNLRMASSQIITARAGYSTIMDLAAIGKKAVLIPTPGQTEQEYLAKNLAEKGIFFTQKQSEFDWKYAIEQAKQYKGWQQTTSVPNTCPYPKPDLTKAIANLLDAAR